MNAALESRPIRLKLPATSANLGPGFDALGLAMSLYLTIDAVIAPDQSYSIHATGRDSHLCGILEGNLILNTYLDVIARSSGVARPLSLNLYNEIPLGMGCGSSAAALLAGVLLANHFGGLGWSGHEAMEEACRREGHPDNVTACFLGGMTASASTDQNHFITASCGINLEWKLMLVLSSVGLATKRARAMLPENYSRQDAVQNVQHTALLVTAFALDRPDLLRTAMIDRLHQPFRSEACPLLPLLLPMVDTPGVLGVALSGAGPSVLLICEPEADRARIAEAIAERAGKVEIIEAGVSNGTTILVT